jgi:hypothetical protein
MPQSSSVPACGPEDTHRAAIIVLWKGYRAAADNTTPQTLWFSVNGSEITPIHLDSRPAPFDLINGAEVTVTRWFYLGPH